MRPIMILAALTLAVAAQSLPATSVHAQTLDKNGRCHDASGKFAKADLCKNSKGTTTAGASVTRAPVADPKGPYTLDAKGKCHDAKGKMAAKAKCA
jgi:hypothetical protein